MDAIKSLNLGTRFFLELCVLAALGYWGFRTGSNWLVKVLLGTGMPLLVAVLWGMFGAPKAPYHLTGLSLIVLEVVVFGSGVAALYTTKQYSLAWVLALLILINRVFMFAWGQ